jgi:hypothetical protein
MADGRKAIDPEIEDDDLSLATEINPAHDIDDLNRGAIRGINLRILAAVTKRASLFPNLT